MIPSGKEGEMEKQPTPADDKGAKRFFGDRRQDGVTWQPDWLWWRLGRREKQTK